MTQGNGPHMAAVIAAATTPAEPLLDEPGPGDTYGTMAEIESHRPGDMSERCLVHHTERTRRL